MKDKEYFIENSTKATASADAKINEILNAYTTGKQSKYFRINLNASETAHSSYNGI